VLALAVRIGLAGRPDRVLDQDALLFAPPALEKDDPRHGVLLGRVIGGEEHVAGPHR